MDLLALKGVGEKKKNYLMKLGISSVEDLLYHFPRDYEDRRSTVSLEWEHIGSSHLYLLVVKGKPTRSFVRKGLSIVRVEATDGIATCRMVWFNMPYVIHRLIPGKKLLVYGKLQVEKNQFTLYNPTLEEASNTSAKEIVPLYPLTKGISNNDLRKYIGQALTLKGESVEENLEDSILEKFGLISRQHALYSLHRPQTMEEPIAAKKRLAFEELLFMAMVSAAHKKGTAKRSAPSIRTSEKLADFEGGLSFTLTASQRQVVKDILNDLVQTTQMNRLVQGDVGSGKTIVAVLAMANAAFSGFQAAFMAPTEILAQQHYHHYKDYFAVFGISCGLLIGSLTLKEKREMLRRIADGSVQMVIGTHAIIQDGVGFSNLGLVITDEQHRFGVRQRQLLSAKGESPHTLLMTATPIPRSLALVLYGDLAISTITQVPTGRKPIETYVVTDDMEQRFIGFLDRQIAEGRQGYIVCPLVEDSEVMALSSVESLYRRLQSTLLSHRRLAILHGKMSSDDKTAVMEAFYQRKIDVLLATTVIEVGMDVPNASVMIVYDSDRFGLAQLHQLRGRVGRGVYQSYCILSTQQKNEGAIKKLQVMERSNDGFEIAEKDLLNRGSGDFYGTRQHGLPQWVYSDFTEYMAWMDDLHLLAEELIDKMEYETSARLAILQKEFKGKCEGYHFTLLN